MLRLLLLISCSTLILAAACGADEAPSDEGRSTDGDACRNEPCAAGFFCKDECVARAQPDSDASARCSPSPESCFAPSSPSSSVCGCDGRVYSSECEANLAGTGFGGSCPPEEWPEGLFGCWSAACELGAQYCERPFGDGNDSNVYFTCHPLPSECEALTTAGEACECVLALHEGDLDPTCTTIERDGVLGITVRHVLF